MAAHWPGAGTAGRAAGQWLCRARQIGVWRNWVQQNWVGKNGGGGGGGGVAGQWWCWVGQNWVICNWVRQNWDGTGEGRLYRCSFCSWLPFVLTVAVCLLKYLTELVRVCVLGQCLMPSQPWQLYRGEPVVECADQAIIVQIPAAWDGTNSSEKVILDWHHQRQINLLKWGGGGGGGGLFTCFLPLVTVGVLTWRNYPSKVSLATVCQLCCNPNGVIFANPVCSNTLLVCTCSAQQRKWCGVLFKFPSCVQATENPQQLLPWCIVSL